MVLNIRNEKVDALARQLAEIDRSSITDAVMTALRETIQVRRRRETAVDAARALLERRGVTVPEAARRPMDQTVWDELHDDPARP